MSLTVLVAVSLCLACGLAQMPAPNLPDTFEAEGEVEFHGAETTDFGRCKKICLSACRDNDAFPHAVMIARDQLKGMGYERESYDDRGEVGEITESVLRYDMNKTFYLRG